MATIDDLYKAIKKIDTAKSPFEGVSYDLTYNDILGLPKGDSGETESKVPSSDQSFIVLSPFAAIPQGEENIKHAASQFIAGEMPIQQSFKAILREGIKLSREQNTLFIDLLDLDQDSNSFFTEGGTKSVAQAIADQLNDPSLKDVKPVVRFLRGTPDQIDAKWWNDRRSIFESMFWPADKQRQPLITNDKAELHVGYYSPSFKMPKQQESAIRGMLLLALWAARYSTKEANAMLDALFNNVTFSASWNHGKILAVGGKTMMTGGINYWNNYTSSQTAILDMQAKVTGDAAVSAHKYADYFWKYLNKAHETDSRSFKWSVTLNQPFDQLTSAWRSNTVVPIFNDLIKPTLKTSGIKVLSVARLGDWQGKTVPDYPVQFVDGLRDLMNNVNAPSAIEKGDFKGLVRMVQLSADTDGILGALRAWDFSPAAWASRTIRVNAIANAKTSVYMSNQMIVGGLQVGNAAYDAMVANLNSGKTGKQVWDGYLWPYDLLLALAGLCLKWRNADSSKIPGIQLVLSGTDAEWGDKRTVRDLFDKVIPLVQGLDSSMDRNAADELVRKWMWVRRIGSDFGPNSIHTKTVCVDEQLLYVGSDNLYPSYNEEHGVWVDDKAALLDWNEGFWKPMWSKLKVPEEKDYMPSS